jgi:hypothetical protein
MTIFLGPVTQENLITWLAIRRNRVRSRKLSPISRVNVAKSDVADRTGFNCRQIAHRRISERNQENHLITGKCIDINSICEK